MEPAYTFIPPCDDEEGIAGVATATSSTLADGARVGRIDALA